MTQAVEYVHVYSVVLPIHIRLMNCSRATAHRPEYLARSVAILALAGLLAPLQVLGQCQPTSDSAKSVVPATQGASPTNPEFYDEPQFTVAGVADTTNLGGHGSDTVVRTKETLAKDTASLSKEPTPNPIAGSVTGDKAVRDDAYELAVADANAGRYEDARNKIRALLARTGIAPEQQAAIHHFLGNVEERLDHPLDAVREYQRAAELNPTEPHLFDWGTELLVHRAADPAIEVFAKGNRLFPQSARMLVGLGVAWHARGAYDRAIQCLCQASDVNPSDPTPYLFLGKMQNPETVQSRDFVERLERFARLQPQNALANYYYATALRSRSKSAADTATLAQVQSLLDKAVRLDPKLGLAHLQLGILYFDRGDFPKAVAAYKLAIEASPQLEEPHYRLAQAYRRLGDKAQAQRELQIYDQLSKKASAEAERKRREIQQFVVTLRDPQPASPPQQKP